MRPGCVSALQLPARYRLHPFTCHLQGKGCRHRMCVGNTLVRLTDGTFRMTLSHHKARGRGRLLS